MNKLYVGLFTLCFINGCSQYSPPSPGVVGAKASAKKVERAQNDYNNDLIQHGNNIRKLQKRADDLMNEMTQ